MQCQKKPNLLLGSSLSIGKNVLCQNFYDHKSKFWSFFSCLCALSNCMMIPLRICTQVFHNSDTNNVLEYLIVEKWAGLYIIGCLVAALASTQNLPAVPTFQLWQPNVSPDIATCPLRVREQNWLLVRTTAILVTALS